MKLGDFNFSRFKQLLDLNSTIIEIGSNNGETTKKFLKMFPDSKIYCFEPDNRAISEFEKQKFPKNVSLFKGAVSDLDGNAKIYLSEDSQDIWNGSSSLSIPKFHKLIYPNISFGQEDEIPTIRLDTFMEQNKIERVGLLWVDVQGLEYQILSSNVKILEKIQYIYLEYSIFKLYENNRKLKDFKKLLKSHQVYELYQNDVLFKRI